MHSVSIKRLRELAERSRDTYAEWVLDCDTDNATRDAMFAALEAYRSATDENTILALLDERRAALALLRHAQCLLSESMDYITVDPDTEFVSEIKETISRIDALLGNSKVLDSQ